ncbi:ataxin-2 homolog [Drosophila miranda]|uniref:ataxin-2 homolog n=1 Tax=Drosophila miranda TaxID=7229 RepID=UPI0007E85F94|nr:ataxin-2 homolog [Drosophila miranda]
MEAKRGNNASATRHATHASRTSVASRHGQQPAAAGGQGATMSRKHVSEASLTTSQARRDTENPRKSPLDALSRAGVVRQQDPFQRRSGLQDVDEAFLATNAFARPSRVRHSGLDGWTDAGAAVPAAAPAAVAPIRVNGGQEQAQVVYQQTQPQQGMPLQAAAATQDQQQMPPTLQQTPPVAAVPSLQQFNQQPAAGQPTRHEPYPTGRAHVHHNQQQQQQQVAYDQQQQQQQIAQQETQAIGQSQSQGQLSPRKYQQQPQTQGFPNQPNVSGGERAAAGGPGSGGQQQQQHQQQQQQQQQQQHHQQQHVGGGAAPPPEAEMCTTCPNCQTTIYLVRSAEMGHGDNSLPTQ